MSSISGSKVIGIEVKITDRCNQECFHCVNMDGGSNGNDIDHKHFIRRLEEWYASSDTSPWTIKEVRITGGEPLMNIPGLLAILECCSTMGIQSGINTNASLITRESAELMKDAGMKVIKISLDTLDKDMVKEIRGSAASLEDILEGIRIAVETGFDVIIRYTAANLNIDHCLSCYDYAKEAGASKFQVKSLIEAGRGEKNKNLLTYKELMGLVYDLTQIVHDDIPVPEILCMPPEATYGLPSKACGSINKIYISTQGQVSSCNFIKPGWIGSIASETLEEILNARFAKTPIQVFNGHQVLANCPHYKRYREQWHLNKVSKRND